MVESSCWTVGGILERFEDQCDKLVWTCVFAMTFGLQWLTRAGIVLVCNGDAFECRHIVSHSEMIDQH
jgi:hypothetical protein